MWVDAMCVLAMWIKSICVSGPHVSKLCHLYLKTNS